MKVLKYPVISITFFFALGIALAYYLKPSLHISVLFAIAAAIPVMAAYFKPVKSFSQKPSFTIAAWLFTASLGTLSCAFHYGPNHSSHYTHSLTTDAAPVITGLVTERLKPNAYADKYYFEIISINKKKATGKILVTLPADSTRSSLNIGDKLVIVDDLKPITPALNPYQFNYAQYMAAQNVFHQVKLKANFYITGQEHNFDYYIDALRNRLIHSFDIHQYDARTLNIIKALLLGQRQDMDSETTTNYTNAGVIHILAISGLHIAVLFYILNMLLRPLSRFRKKGKLAQLIVVLGFLWLFAFLTGLSASVLRSVVMFSFISIGLYFNRSSSIYNSIAVSMLFLLLINPMLLFDVGFQLSYAAVFAIVWLQPLYRKLAASKHRAVNYITDTVLISLTAQVGVLPLSLYYFNQFPLLFLLANVVVVPLSTIVLITGIVVLALNFTWPDAALIAGKLLYLLTDLMNTFIAWIASFDALVLKNIPFNLLLNVILYAVIISGAVWLYRSSFKRAVVFILAVLAFQIAYINASILAKKHKEIVIFHNRESSLVATKHQEMITVYSNDSLVAENRNLLAYNKGYFNQAISIKPLKNLLWFRHKKIFVIDSLAVYDPDIAPDILLLTQSPKINLERVLLQLRPKQVVADATNYRTYIARWASTCQKQKIPFHATAEKGSFIK